MRYLLGLALVVVGGIAAYVMALADRPCGDARITPAIPALSAVGLSVKTVLRFNALGKALEAQAAAMTDDEPSNCLLWALRQRQRHGGALVIHDSEYGPWKHVQWRSESGDVWEYEPIEPKYTRTDVPTLFAGQPRRVS